MYIVHSMYLKKRCFQHGIHTYLIFTWLAKIIKQGLLLIVSKLIYDDKIKQKKPLILDFLSDWDHWHLQNSTHFYLLVLFRGPHSTTTWTRFHPILTTYFHSCCQFWTITYMLPTLFSCPKTWNFYCLPNYLFFST